jgi:FkbM family methyltransferase
MLKRFVRAMKQAAAPSQMPRGKVSFSQCGEDLLIDYVLQLRGIHKPSYIDIGAHDPFSLSNTAIFYARGCRGINIEANPMLIGRFQGARPEDTNLNVGVGDSDGELDFFIMKDSTLSTFSEKEVNALKGYGHQLDRVERIKVRTVQAIVDQYAGGVFPDVMSLDVEGQDLAILRSINFNGSVPRVICVEAAEYSPVGAGARNDQTISHLKENGYFEYANTNLNAIMVNQKFWNAPPAEEPG